MNSTPAANQSANHSSARPAQLSPSVRTAGRRVLVRLGAAVVLTALAALSHFAAGVWLPAGLVEPLGLGEDGTNAVRALTVPLLLLAAAAVALVSAGATAVRAPGLATAPKIMARTAWNSAGVLAAGGLVLVVGAPLAFYGLLGALWAWPDQPVVIVLVYGVPVLMVVAGIVCVVRSVRVVRSRSSLHTAAHR